MKSTKDVAKVRESKLDLHALRIESIAVRERIQQWPQWTQDIAREVSEDWNLCFRK